MFRFSLELFQGLFKMFVRTNKRFPNPEERRFIQNQAIRIKDDLLAKKIDLDAINAEEALRIYSQYRPKRPGPKADVLPFKYKKSFADELAEMEKKGELPKSQGIGSLVDDTIEMLKGKDFNRFVKNIKDDKFMEKYRKIFYLN